MVPISPPPKGNPDYQRLEKIVLTRRRRYHSGIGGIYKYLRTQSRFWLWGDIPLLAGILIVLSDHGIYYSKHEVYRAFRFMNLDDYAKEDKHQIYVWLFSLRTVTKKVNASPQQNAPLPGQLSLW